MRVLVVEDNAAESALVRAFMRDGDAASAEVATSLAEALAAIDRSSFDVAIIDVSLPDAEGIDVVRRVREHAPRLPVVVLSGRQDDEFAALAVAAGAQEFLFKGAIGDVVLRRALRHAIERQQLIDRLAASVDELQRQRASVIELNDLKNDLIAVLAHDFKGPLTTVMGFAELLESGALEEADAREAAGTIRASAARLAALANDVLALSRAEHGELEIRDERVDLVSILRDVTDEVRHDRDVRIDVRTEDPFIDADGERIRQIIDNLVRNAIKYSPDGQLVDVVIGDEGEYTRIDVIDRGIGIPREEIPTLFRRFARASNAKKARIKGTGIGLFLVKLLVDRHAGRIAIESRENEGTTFTVLLPRTSATRDRVRPRVAILTADEHLRSYLAYELRSREVRVGSYASAETFAAQADGHAFVAVFVDRNLRVDAAHVRSMFANGSVPKVIGIGASANAGYDAVLPEPFLAAELYNVLDRTGVTAQTALLR